MDVAVEFNQAAFKHGVSEADDKHLLLGFDCKGNLLEVMYSIIDEQTVNVFHAMKCRSIYCHLLNL